VVGAVELTTLIRAVQVEQEAVEQVVIILHHIKE
jgi:hypothetical protein